MILDGIENLGKYITNSELLEHMQDYLGNVGEYSTGRYEMKYGFFLIQAGETTLTEDCLFETHRQYIDVQCLIDGEEFIEWAQENKLAVERPYDGQKDIELLTGEGSKIKIAPMQFYVFFQSDAHKACCNIGSKTKYKKIVFKINRALMGE